MAADIVDKLVRRHPHVFGTATAETAADVEAGWERAKAAEKGRSSAVDGVPMAMPALSLAAKMVHRAEKNGVAVDPVDGDGLGDRLMALAVEARAAGLDPEAELRAAVRRFAARVQAAEAAQAPAEPADPAGGPTWGERRGLSGSKPVQEARGRLSLGANGSTFEGGLP